MRAVCGLIAFAALAVAQKLACPRNNEISTVVPSYEHHMYTSALGTMAGVHENLLACPEIESLDLRVTYLGCSQGPDRFNFPIRLAGGDVYPNITSLQLEGYEFEQSDWKDALPRRNSYSELIRWYGDSWGFEKWFPLWRVTPKQRRQLTNLQLWLEAMDWTKLQSLAFRGRVDQHFADIATPYLSGLKQLAFHWSEENSGDAIQQIILTLPEVATLTSLTWAGAWRPEVLEQILEKHGATLHQLELYTIEPIFGTPAVVAQTVPQLELIARKSPNLERLSLSLDRNGSWPWEALKIISGISTLTSVDIWLELAAECNRDPFLRLEGIPTCQNSSIFRYPKLNDVSASDVFKYLLKENQDGAFQNVTFWIGDWDRVWDGPLWFGAWLYGKRGKVECSLLNGEGSYKSAEDPLCVQTISPRDDAWSWPKQEIEDYYHDEPAQLLIDKNDL